MLDVNGVTVTSNVTHTLHCILQLPALRDYYLERFKWSWETFESMDWMSFHQAFKNKKRHAFLVKLGFKKLPVGERIHRWADHYDSRCPHCLLPDETDDHLFQCVDPSRSEWRTSFLDCVRDSAEDWDPTLLDILLAGLSSHLHNTVFDPSSWSDPTYQQLLAEQISIGWDHFIRGKWSKEWARLQFEFKKATNKTHTKDPIAAMIRLFFEKSHNLWLLRNGKRHGNDQQTRQAARRETYRREITSLYSLALLPADAKVYFKDDLEELLDKDLITQRSWLTTHRQLIKKAARRRASSSIANTSPLDTYFPSVGSTRGRGIRVPRRRRRCRISTTERIRRDTARTHHITHFMPVASTTRHNTTTSSTNTDTDSTAGSTMSFTRSVQRSLTSYFPPRPVRPPRQQANLHPDHPG